MWSLRLRVLPTQWAPAQTRALSSFRSHESWRGPRNSTRKPGLIRASKERVPSQQPQSAPATPQDTPRTEYDPSQNTLLSPVYLPEDPRGVLKENHPATSILANSGIVVQRKLEMMNIMIGFEQANKYEIMDAQGNYIGWMAEQEKGMANMMSRQWFHTHRSFVTHVFDRQENEVLRFHRPFSWINSKIHVYDPLNQISNTDSQSTSLQTMTPESLIAAGDGSNTRISPLGTDQMRVIGEAQQQWAPLRRKYNLFTHEQSPNPATDMRTQNFSLSKSDLSEAQQMQLVQASHKDQGQYNQFAYVDEPFLSWDFALKSANNQVIGSVNRNFSGFAREIFTDTGVYAMRMDSAGQTTESSNSNQSQGLTLDQRAVMLATAVSIDFDYFSRHSNANGGLGFMPMWFPGGGGGTSAGGVATGEAAGEAGAIGEAAAGTVGRAGIPGGMGAGATGAGAMAGYEAMQRGNTNDSNAPGSPEQAVSNPTGSDSPGIPDGSNNPWGDDAGDDEPWDDEPWGDEGGDGGEGEGGGFLDDFFGDS